jgi:hypothetical protein
MRGRSGGGGNRKGANPLTRNYESNGPDVKIRGSAQQVAEKYTNLARDAHSAGDRVMAENYLQHAEHYNRIIAAAQSQLTAQQVRDNRDEYDDEGEDEREDMDTTPVSAAPEPHKQAPDKQAPVAGAEPQPVIEGMPAEVALEQETVSRERGKQRQANGGDHDEGRQRRARRPRRSRTQDEQPSSGDAGEGAKAGADEGRGEAREQDIVLPTGTEG